MNDLTSILAYVANDVGDDKYNAIALSITRKFYE
jgi:hypothetical protein